MYRRRVPVGLHLFSPVFQVDLLLPMVIEGVQIFVLNAFIVNEGEMHFLNYTFQFTNDSAQFTVTNGQVRNIYAFTVRACPEGTFVASCG